MGLVEVKVVLTNPSEGITLEETGLVDGGATLTVLPRKVAKSLRLVSKESGKVMTAGGPITIDLSHVEIHINGKAETIRVAISDVIDKILIGVTTLETLALTVDPLTGQLKESMYLLY